MAVLHFISRHELNVLLGVYLQDGSERIEEP